MEIYQPKVACRCIRVAVASLNDLLLAQGRVNHHGFITQTMTPASHRTDTSALIIMIIVIEFICVSDSHLCG